jgi:ABC-type spermidine/putrescine transport system permease subunit II
MVKISGFKDGIVAGAVFCFLLSFDNVALSIFLSRGDTLPLRLMLPLGRAMRRERLVW